MNVEKGRDAAGEVILLQVKVPKGREREDIRRKLSIEAIGSETENLERIKSSYSVGRDRAEQSNAWEMDRNHSSSIFVAGNANPGGAD